MKHVGLLQQQKKTIMQTVNCTKISSKLISGAIFTGNSPLRVHATGLFYTNFLQLQSSLLGLIIQLISRSVLLLLCIEHNMKHPEDV